MHRLVEHLELDREGCDPVGFKQVLRGAYARERRVHPHRTGVPSGFLHQLQSAAEGRANRQMDLGVIMKTSVPAPSVSDYRHQAKRLLKQLRSDSDPDLTAAAERFRRLRSFAAKTASELSAEPGGARLKHALTVIAVENGHESWTAFKDALTTADSKTPERLSGREMYEPGLDVLLNRWFARYEEARKSLKELGGYLLPYDRQFFICEKEGIRVLGLDPEDSDWQRIAFDWVKPKDDTAWQRLERKRLAVLGQ